MSPDRTAAAQSDPEDDWESRRRSRRATPPSPDLNDCVIFETAEGQPRLAQRPDDDRLYAFERPDRLGPYPAHGEDAALPVLHQAGRLDAARLRGQRVRVLPVDKVLAARVPADLVVAAPQDRWTAQRVALLADLDVVVTLANDKPSASELGLVRRLQLTAAAVAVERARAGRWLRPRWEPVSFDDLQQAHDALVTATLLGVPLRKLPAARPRNRDLVEGLIQHGLVLCVGPTWSGKSTIIAGLCDAVAKRRNWLGRETQAGAVLVACGEAAETMRRRCVAAAAAHPEQGLGPSVVPVSWRLHDESGDHHLRLLNDTLKRLPDARLLVIDTLASVTPGMPESESSAMGTVLGRLRRLMRDHPQLTVIVIHHPLKSGEGVRGHGSLEAQADAQLEVTQSGGEVVLTLKHSRDLPSGTRHRFVLEDRDGVGFARPLPGDAPARAGEAVKGDRRRGLREALLKLVRDADGPVHRSELINSLGIGNTAFYDLLKAAPEVKRVGGPKDARYQYAGGEPAAPTTPNEDDAG